MGLSAGQRTIIALAGEVLGPLGYRTCPIRVWPVCRRIGAGGNAGANPGRGFDTQPTRTPLGPLFVSPTPIPPTRTPKPTDRPGHSPQIPHHRRARRCRRRTHHYPRRPKRRNPPPPIRLGRLRPIHRLTQPRRIEPRRFEGRSPPNSNPLLSGLESLSMREYHRSYQLR